MAESLISDLCKAVGSKVLEEGYLLLGVPEEAKKLTTNLKRIKALLKAAEQRELQDDVKEWICELKDVAYGIEDVLDDWSIAQQQMKDQFGTSSQHGNTNKPKAKDQVCFTCIPTPSFCFKQTKSRHEIASTIKNINSKLDEIYENKKKFEFPKSNTTSINEVTGHEINTSYEEFIVVQSQREDKHKLVNKLVQGDFKSSAADRIPIISIVGMGGIGKTTLARMVYDDETVKGHFPNNVTWVCVSNTFNALNVAKAIAHGFRVQLLNDCEPQYVLTEIENWIKDRKFLIVLDDVWEDSEGKWGAILKCLAKGDTQGSRILMTTRNSEFSQKMGAVFALTVGVLSETDAWSLFSYYAFPVDSKHREIVEDIARKLVKKCDGLPLAIQVLGRHMLTKTTRSQWHDVYTSKIWDTSFREKVFNSLAFSYLELRSEAKRCLAFCSIFPKDTVMSKNELIRLWIAQGYLQEREAGKMEDFGEECFDSLVRRSFFQVSKTYRDDTDVVMHDIIHDFAQYIFSGEVAILDPSFQMPKGSQILRHLGLNENESNCPYSSFDRKALRSLFLYKYPKEFLKDFFPNNSYLRALMLRDESKELHDGDLRSIGKLEHLRFISLSSNNLTMLPEEICSLPFLQTLDLSRCCELKSLPKEIRKLTCLRHLLFSDDSMDSLPKGLGNLHSLQTLSYFLCSNLDSKDCSSLEDLGDLNDLRGDLELKYLNQVAQVNEATRAQLHMKKQIRELALEFGEGNPSLQSDVLEALEPAKGNIEFLKISGYRGRRCPRWINQLQYLKEIRLKGVNMDSLPELGTLLCLEELYVRDAKEVKRVGAEFFGTCTREDNVFFRKLTRLKFGNMSQWEHWEGPKEMTGCCVTIMPLLRYLKLSGTGLRSLPRFLEDVPLETLNVEDCHLPPIECTEVNCAKKLRIGDIVVPETLQDIDIRWAQSEKEAPVNQPVEASKEVQQPPREFDLSKMDASLCFVTCSVPRWVMDLTYLRSIRLRSVKDECLPPFGLMPSLEELTIEEAINVEKVGDEFLGISDNNRGGLGGGDDENEDNVFFRKLTRLEFGNMSQWEHWEGPTEMTGCCVTIMPLLCYLKLIGTGLRSLPRFLEDVPLETLNVEDCHLRPIECTEVNCAKKWRIGDIVVPETLKEIDITWAQSEKEAPVNQPVEASTEVQQPPREFELSKMDAYLCFVTRSVPRSVMDLTYLRSIRLGSVKDECLPPFGLMPSLEELTIKEAINVEKVGNEFLGISDNNRGCLGGGDDENKDRSDGGGASTASFAFPRLKKLHFRFMPSWETWEDPVHKNGDLVIMPILCHLDLYMCNKLKCLPHFFEAVPLKTLEVEAWPGGGVPEIHDKRKILNIRNTTAQSEPVFRHTINHMFRRLVRHAIKEELFLACKNYSGRLRGLQLKCDAASLVALEMFPSLEILSLNGIFNIRRIGKEVTRISRLKELYLDSMENLEEWEDPSSQLQSSSNEMRELSRNGNDDNNTAAINSTPRFRILSLLSCRKLKALPGFLKCMPLEELIIINCDALETWWANEAGEDWRNWTSRIPRFEFTSVQWKDGDEVEYDVLQSDR